ncbi:hypothetical protein M501DRAFT_1016918 [Patellaria atrata CBS 101060]|uniref:Uncharacterized protein n=1 Tax=Patellaria atrata CBS 101060 TaxID=1346257 RepID=A0A9P4SA39_9PEZI|nr:hypothetical protein M501DRAFT_1016918 [Patellaria atrata CBS 101060]
MRPTYLPILILPFLVSGQDPTDSPFNPTEIVSDATSAIGSFLSEATQTPSITVTSESTTAVISNPVIETLSDLLSTANSVLDPTNTEDIDTTDAIQITDALPTSSGAAVLQYGEVGGIGAGAGAGLVGFLAAVLGAL